MISPFSTHPHPSAQKAAAEVMKRVHAYMNAHPDSELHRQGKMFGVLVTNEGYIAAFSAMLDGSYHHEGFVPPIWDQDERSMPIGHNKAESQRLQRLLFAQYNFVNGRGENKNLLEIFAQEKPILSSEEWFSRHGEKRQAKGECIPPAGAGECCGPKLLQYAFTHGLQPLALAEFWIGAPSKTEIRQEGLFYAPCSGKCVPILRHMLQGLDIAPAPEEQQAEELCKQIEILYEDDYLMVVNKPAGLLSVPGKREEHSAESYLSHRLSASGTLPIFLKAAHRLDQDTSGLFVLAKTPEVYTSLQAYFQRRDILKRYEAVLKPNNATELPDDGMISLPLLPNPYDRPRQMVNYEHGKQAITQYVIRERRADGTILVDFYPQTGRTHQLRVHAAHPDGLNAPIIGDRLYGTPGERLMLHAAEIRFVHPITGEQMHFETTPGIMPSVASHPE